ncbi:unnamed protein product [Phaedon cochleariae]|uniref:C2H2-type domain-containing protein n=1 Tax=Phaedon cochleariae TaxID=80249 RepID=A0A9P0DER0_PHACE|nr:unnamed protein product [Phaedon cochleariae]
MPELSRSPSNDKTIRGHKVSSTYLWNILFEDISKEWISFKPTLGIHVYPCYSCRHMFSSLRSLQDHVNRRIILLKYNCAICLEKQIFYNRCSFLLHARTHFDLDQGHINLSDIEIHPLPIHLAGFLPYHGIEPLYREEEEELIANNVYINAQFYSPDFIQKGKSQIVLTPSDLLFKQNSTTTLGLKQICKNLPKCEFITLEEQNNLRKQTFLVESLIEDNFEIKNEPSDYCDQVTLPIISKVESLQDKADDLPYCLDCNVMQEGTMAEHYQGDNRPTDSSLCCSKCKFIASTKCSLRAHVRIHSGAAPHICPDCGENFDTYDQVNSHMNEVCFHLSKSVRFRCPGKRCGKLFATPTTFAAHFKIHFKCMYTCCLCKSVFLKTEEAAVHAATHQEICKFRREYECTLCQDLGTLNESGFEAHLEYHTTDTERCMYAYMCKNCRSYFRSTLTYAVHLLKCNDKGKAVTQPSKSSTKYVTADCEICHNKIIYPPDKPVKSCCRCRSQQIQPKLTTKRYYCILCSQQIQFKEKISHMKVCRYARPMVVLDKMVSDDSFQSSNGDISPSRRLSLRRSGDRGEENQKKKRKRYHVPSHSRRKVMEPDLTAEKPVLFDGVYNCKACEFTSTERADFHVHIKTHRDISTAYQCMECGECFVVKPSLYKHLMHFHNISDYQSYLQENDCYDVDAVQELENTMRLAPGESKEPVRENQCRVCRVQFEDSAALNIHFRIHGMAFLLKNAK